MCRILVIVVPPVDELDLVFSARQLQGRPLTMHVVTTGSVLEVAEVGVLVGLRLVTHQIVRQAVRKLQRIFISIIIPLENPMSASLASPKAGMEPSPANIQLMQLTNAFWTSRCLHVVAELGVADHLGDQPQSTESLARATGTRPDPLHRVLRLLASVGIFEWKDGTFPNAFVTILAESKLSDSTPTRVMFDGVPILLVRRGQRISAMADTCSHFSGPLSEGKLVGDSIVCPYHASRFGLDDGRVHDGPAVHPQPCLEVRVRNGQIEVRKPAAKG